MELAAIQRLFGDQSALPRTIAAIGDVLVDSRTDVLRLPREALDDQVVHLVLDGNSGWTVSARSRMTALEMPMSFGEPDRHVLIISAARLRALMPSLAMFPSNGVVVLRHADTPISEMIELQRALFDRGLVGIGSIAINGEEAHCFLASHAVTSTRELGGIERGRVSMASLGTNGRFGNQLFQYACIKFYALRHGLKADLPEWEGKALFGLPESMPDGPCQSKLRFNNSMQDDRILWEMDEPPINVDLRGYFQELPECWRLHRPLLRRLFQLGDASQSTLNAWRQAVTRGGDRTLVAIHVRRGDYRGKQDRQWFRLVPDEWYLDWLREVWSTLRDPVLFVATDEPNSVLPSFREFDIVSTPDNTTRQGLPDHVFDFEVLRGADLLAICNSSFSRMAAILASDDQKCFCPSFATERFTPYAPWNERFWERFGRVREEDAGLKAVREQTIDLRLGLGELSWKLARQDESIAELREQQKLLRSQHAQVKKRLDASRSKLKATEDQLNTVLQSRSWRVTEPLRRCLGWLKRS